MIVAFIGLAGCGIVTTNASRSGSTPTAPRPSPRASDFTLTPSTAGADVYTDELAGYSVTFPGQPDVRPLAISGTDRLANIALYADTSTFALVARGEVRDSPPNVQEELFEWLQSVNTIGPVGASGGDFAGLPDAQAQFTEGGLPGQTIVASDGNRFFQLIAIGGTAQQRQAFFASFRLTKRNGG